MRWPPRRLRISRVWALILVALVADLVVLVAAPCHQGYTGYLPPAAQQQLSVPSFGGAEVSVHWYSPVGVDTQVSLYHGSDFATASLVRNSSGIQGTLTFRATSGSWWLWQPTAAKPITFVVSYSAPLL